MTTVCSESRSASIREPGHSGLWRAHDPEAERFGQPSPGAAAEDHRPRFPLPVEEAFPDWVACRGED